MPDETHEEGLESPELDAVLDRVRGRALPFLEREALPEGLVVDGVVPVPTAAGREAAIVRLTGARPLRRGVGRLASAGGQTQRRPASEEGSREEVFEPASEMPRRRAAIFSAFNTPPLPGGTLALERPSPSERVPETAPESTTTKRSPSEKRSETSSSNAASARSVRDRVMRRLSALSMTDVRRLSAFSMTDVQRLSAFSFADVRPRSAFRIRENAARTRRMVREPIGPFPSKRYDTGPVGFSEAKGPLPFGDVGRVASASTRFGEEMGRLPFGGLGMVAAESTRFGEEMGQRPFRSPGAVAAEPTGFSEAIAGVQRWTRAGTPAPRTLDELRRWTARPGPWTGEPSAAVRSEGRTVVHVDRVEIHVEQLADIGEIEAFNRMLGDALHEERFRLGL